MLKRRLDLESKDYFDILIGATAIANSMVMVTNNVVHLSRLDNIITEDWTALTKK